MYNGHGQGGEKEAYSRGLPTVMPEAAKLCDRLVDLRSIFANMSVTDRDRASATYSNMLQRFGELGIGPADPEARTEYMERCYLQHEADEAFTSALVGGQIPVWASHERGFAQLDPDILFATNKWDQRAVLHAGVYRPMNLRRDFGDDRRALCEDAVLWTKDQDWRLARDNLVRERERRFHSELPVPIRMATGIGCPRHAIPDVPELPARDPKHKQFSDHIWKGDSAQWAAEAVTKWPEQDGDCVFLGHAVLQLGRARFGGHWVDDIPMVGRPPEVVPEPPINDSGLWLEGYLNERDWARAMRSRALWPMFDAVVDELVLAAQAGDLRCFSRQADHLELKPIGRKSWRLPESIAVFKRCSIDPARPFAGVPGHGTAQSVFVNATDLKALVDADDWDSQARAEVGTRRPTVSLSELRRWVSEANQKGWSQDKIAKAAAEAFPSHTVPGRSEIRRMDTKVRQELGLPPRRKGAPKGNSPA